MNIAYDAKRLFNNHTGLGNYSRTLVSNFKRFYPEEDLKLFATDIAKSDYYADFKDYEVVLPGRQPKFWWRSYSISKQINRAQVDIYHGLSNEIPFSAPKIQATKIVTIHDLFFLKYPHDFTKIDRWIYKKKTSFACEHADHIISISESTKSDLVNFLNVKEEKITTVYQSCGSIFQNQTKSELPEGSNLPDRYFLYVGTLNQRKNIQLLLEGLSRIPKKRRIPIVVVGSGTTAFRKELSSRIVELGIVEEVIFLGNVESHFLKAIYQGAVCTVLTSFYEGFGIPVIESLFCGTPVIVSDVSALPEAAGDCGIHIAPTDLDKMINTLQSFINDDQLRNQLVRNMKSHLVKFGSFSTAEKLRSTYLNFY